VVADEFYSEMSALSLVVNSVQNQCGVYDENYELGFKNDLKAANTELKAGWEKVDVKKVFGGSSGTLLYLDEVGARTYCDKLGMEFVGVNTEVMIARGDGDQSETIDELETMKDGSILIAAILGVGLGAALIFVIKHCWLKKSRLRIRKIRGKNK
jgi:hypothetical protein